MFPALKEASERLAAKQDALGNIFKEAGPDVDLTKVTSIDGDTKAKAEQIRALNDELGDLGKEVQSLKAVQAAAEAAEGYDRGGVESGAGDRRDNGDRAAKSFGEMFTKSKAYANKGLESEIDVDLKTLMTTTAGLAPETTRSGLVVDFATRPLEVVDLIPQIPWNQAAYSYVEETTFTNAAAETAEAGAYPEAALAFTAKQSPVQKITVWLPVTDEQLEDVPSLSAYIDQRLGFMVRQRLDSQILVGNGTAPNLRGVLNTVGIQTQAKGTDPTPDAVYKAIVKVRTVAFSIPDAYVTNPLDWQDVRLLRTADGIYIWGSPSEAGPERIWGLRVAQANGLTENTGVVGDFGNNSLLAVKRGVETKVSNSHSTFFVEGKQAVRADMRAALVFTRPAAFCTVTGI